MTEFVFGFGSVGRVLLTISGGLSAVALFLIAAFLVALIAGTLFDRCTNSMAKRWEKKGKQPKGKWGQIILSYHRRRE